MEYKLNIKNNNDKIDRVVEATILNTANGLSIMVGDYYVLSLNKLGECELYSGIPRATGLRVDNEGFIVIKRA